MTAPPNAVAAAPLRPTAPPMAAPRPGAIKLRAIGRMVLNSFFNEKYCGYPVCGLMVPAPPRAFSIAASSGEMWAIIVSPMRP